MNYVEKLRLYIYPVAWQNAKKLAGRLSLTG